MRARGPGFSLIAACAACAVITVLALAHVRYWASSSRLPERGELRESVRGLDDRVEILLDGGGIPHVRAQSEGDAWFSLGYLHARERFFQMDMARRAASGRLAEIFGEEALVKDRKMRTLRIGTAILNHVAQLDEGEKAALEAYAAGVNSALESSGRWIAPEIWLLGIDPEPWLVEDSVAVALLMQLSLSWSMGEELKRSVELARLGKERALDLWGWTPHDAESWIPPIQAPSMPRHADDAITAELPGGASTNWAIAASRTASGRPLLANATNVAVHLPSTWYGVHLQAPGIDVAGVSVPGIPGVVIGHTGGVAWGFTPSMMDDQDLFLLTLDESRTREEIDGAWRPLRTVTERIDIRWRDEPELMKVRISERGPIIRDSGGSVLALTWGGAVGPSSIRAFLRMARSNSVADLVSSWEGVAGPPLNMVAADVNGHILHQVVGLAPERSYGAGRLVAPGSDSLWAWRGYLPLAVNPHTLDPPRGFLTTASHDIFSEGDYEGSERFPGEFMSPWPVRRSRAVLAGRDNWDVAGCLRLQGDVVSMRAIATLKQLWPDLERHGGPTATALSNWNGRMNVDTVAPHLFSRLMMTLIREVGGDEALREGLRASPLDEDALLRLLAGGLDGSWWDDLRTSETEGREQIIDRCLDEVDAMALKAKWGEVHQVAFVHPLARFPVIGPLFELVASLPPAPVAGGAGTVSATPWAEARPFAVAAIPSMRFVADVGNWDASVLVVPPGQSGRPWSTRYADQLGDWLQSRGRILPFSAEAVEEAARARVVLEPVGDVGEF